MLVYYIGKPTLPDVKEKEIYRVSIQANNKSYVREFYAEDEISNGSKSPFESLLHYFRCEYPDEELPRGNAEVYVHFHDSSWREHSSVHSWGKWKPIRPPYNSAYRGRV